MYIINYHNIVRDEDYDEFDRQIFTRTTSTSFEKDVEFLSKRFQFMSLKGLVDLLTEGTFVSDAIAFTFDDAYSGVNEYALPLLESFGTVGSVFVVSQYPTKDHFHFDELEIAFRLSGNMSIEELRSIKDKLKGLPHESREQEFLAILHKFGIISESIDEYAASHRKYRPMSWQEVNDACRRGHIIGSHTKNHYILSTLTDEEATDEIAGSLQILKNHVKGISWIPFAYPYGKAKHISDTIVEIVRNAGYSCGLTTIPGQNAPNTDIYTLKRVELENGRFI